MECILLVLAVLLPVAGIVGGVRLLRRGTRAARAGEARPAARARIAAVGCFVIVAYYAAWLAGVVGHAVAVMHVEQDLRQGIFFADLGYCGDQNSRRVPARWVGSGPEPLFAAGGRGTPYGYLAMPDFQLRDDGRDTRWLAYTPGPIPRPWWVIWDPQGPVDRIALEAGGRLRRMTEAEFQAELARQQARSEAETARAATQPDEPITAPRPGGPTQ